MESRSEGRSRRNASWFKKTGAQKRKNLSDSSSNADKRPRSAASSEAAEDVNASAASGPSQHGPKWVGVIATCDIIRERECVRELLKVLDQWWEDYGLSSDVPREDAQREKRTDIAAELEAELAELRNSGSRPRFSVVRDSVPKGNVVVRFNVEGATAGTVADFVRTVFDRRIREAAAGPAAASTVAVFLRHTVTLRPVEYVCRADESALRRMAARLRDERILALVPPPVTFMAEVRRRYIETFDSNDVKRWLGEEVRLPTDYRRPDAVVVVDVLQMSAYLSVLTGDQYRSLAGYNLRKAAAAAAAAVAAAAADAPAVAAPADEGA
jgi:hypothetical protein